MYPPQMMYLRKLWRSSDFSFLFWTGQLVTAEYPTGVVLRLEVTTYFLGMPLGPQLLEPLPNIFLCYD